MIRYPFRATCWLILRASALVVAWGAVLTPVLGVPAHALEAKRWITYRSESAGFAFEYPPDVFAVVAGDPTEALRGRTEARAGRIFTTADGRASLQIATVPNLDKASVGQLRDRAVAASYKKARLDYNRVAESWYVVSGIQGASTFYERVHFSCGGRRLDIWTVTYPSAEGKDFEPMIDEMARRFRSGLSAIRCG
jgi:hypothetical protein